MDWNPGIQASEINSIIGYKGKVAFLNSAKNIRVLPSLHPEVDHMVGLMISGLSYGHKGRVKTLVNQERH